MPISSTPVVGTEESYAFNVAGNTVAKIYAQANGAGDASITGLVIEADYTYMGDPITNGSWRFHSNTGDLVFEKRESGVWNEKGKFIG